MVRLCKASTVVSSFSIFLSLVLHMVIISCLARLPSYIYILIPAASSGVLSSQDVVEVVPSHIPLSSRLSESAPGMVMLSIDGIGGLDPESFRMSNVTWIHVARVLNYMLRSCRGVGMINPDSDSLVCPALIERSTRYRTQHLEMSAWGLLKRALSWHVGNVCFFCRSCVKVGCSRPVGGIPAIRRVALSHIAHHPTVGDGRNYP